jgi:hypothetical protein
MRLKCELLYSCSPPWSTTPQIFGGPQRREMVGGDLRSVEWLSRVMTKEEVKASYEEFYLHQDWSCLACLK